MSQFPAILGVVAVSITITLFIFNLGVNVNKFRNRSITPDQLKEALSECRIVQDISLDKKIQDLTEESFKTCRNTQAQKLTDINDKIQRISAERAEIWEIVRATEKHTAVIVAEINWIKNSIDQLIKEVRK